MKKAVLGMPNILLGSFFIIHGFKIIFLSTNYGTATRATLLSLGIVLVMIGAKDYVVPGLNQITGILDKKQKNLIKKAIKEYEQEKNR